VGIVRRELACVCDDNEFAVVEADVFGSECVLVNVIAELSGEAGEEDELRVVVAGLFCGCCIFGGGDLATLSWEGRGGEVALVVAEMHGDDVSASSVCWKF
jgi:hypothetical protein